MRKQVGIYQIRNTINGWVYIGSSVRVNIRLTTHMSDLRHNRHCNNKLQADANLYGINAFTTSILEILPDASTNQEISDREQHYTEQAHKDGPCYNYPLAVTRPMQRVCQICGSEWHYSRNMCQSHYADYLKSFKKGLVKTPDEYIALRKTNPKKRLSTILKGKQS